jgi:hypothetical protein
MVVAPVVTVVVAMVIVPIVAMIVAAIVVTVVVPIVAMVVAAMLIAIAVAIVGLRRGDDAAQERDRNSRSSEQTFHVDLPD